MFVPEAELPVWVVCYVPVIMSFLSILPAPRSFPFIAPYLLFENTMSVTKFNAMVSGLFQLGSSYEWVVTKKAGRSSEPDLLAASERESKVMNHPQLYRGTSDSRLSDLNKLIEHQEAIPKASGKKMNKIYKKELALASMGILRRDEDSPIPIKSPLISSTKSLLGASNLKNEELKIEESKKRK